jgi:hypothetical protein
LTCAAEAERRDAFSGPGESGWDQLSRSAGWTVRDVLGHLVMGEDYHRACLDGTVAAFLARYAERGGKDLDSANALGVADYALVPGKGARSVARRQRKQPPPVPRTRSRRRGHSLGDYPFRWQAIHVVAELATHADDFGVTLTRALEV